MQSVYEVIPEVWEFKPIISNKRISEVLKIILNESLSKDDLEKCYGAVFPDEDKKYTGDFTLFLILKYVSHIPQKNNQIPFLEFISHLAYLIDDESFRLKIRGWIKDVKSEIDDINYGEPQKKRSVHLLVELSTEPNNRNNSIQYYSLKVNVWRDKHVSDCIDFKGQCEIENIPAKIDEVVETKIKEDEVVCTIEFILPCELIALDIEHLTYEDYGNKTKIVKYNQIITRRINRYWYKSIKIPKRQREEWEKRWLIFNTYAKDVSCIHWECDFKTCDFDGLHNVLSSSESKACLFMTYLPEKSSEIIKLGEVILISGIPVVLWVRVSSHDTDRHEEVKNEIKQIIKGANLTELPTLIHRKQKEAIKEEDLGNYLALLWDNPARDYFHLKQTDGENNE
jgi:hypothetical protein